MLRKKDYLLLFLAGVADLISEGYDRYHHPYKYIYNDFPWKKRSILDTVYNSLKTGDIEKVIKNGEVYLRITGQGKDRLRRDFPISHWQEEEWDEKWRVVIFDIPEKKKRVRDRLREKLRELGFGMIQESVWISPYDVAKDIRDFLVAQGLGNNAYVLVCEDLYAGNEKELANNIWRLEEINEQYEDWIEKVKSLRRKEVKRAKELKLEYLNILAIDPHLPEELLPDGWFGEEAKEIYKLLLEEFRIEDQKEET